LNDYLGMGRSRVRIEAACDAARAMGVGAGGTRNISGTNRVHEELEAELADLHRKDAALLFTSGFVSNHAAISAILNSMPGWLVYSDEKNYASMIAGIRSPKGRVPHFSPQRPRSSGVAAARITGEFAEADRVRVSLFNGRRHRPDRSYLRPRDAIWCDDLS
jgi:hypothetical protein